MIEQYIVFLGENEEVIRTIIERLQMKMDEKEDGKDIWIYLYFSKINREKVKKIIKEMGIIKKEVTKRISEIEIDYEFSPETLKKIKEIIAYEHDSNRGKPHQRKKEIKIIFDITGASKPLFLAIMLFITSEIAHNEKKVKYFIRYLKKGEEGKSEYVTIPINKLFYAMYIIGKHKKNIGREEPLKREILELLQKENAEITITELSKKLKRSKATISTAISALEEEGIVIKEREGRKVFIKIDEFSKKFIKLIEKIKKGERK